MQLTSKNGIKVIKKVAFNSSTISMEMNRVSMMSPKGKLYSKKSHLKETLKSSIKHLESSLRKITILKTFLTLIGSKRLSRGKGTENNQVSRLDQNMSTKRLRGNILTYTIQCFAWRHYLKIKLRRRGTILYKLVTPGSLAISHTTTG